MVRGSQITGLDINDLLRANRIITEEIYIGRDNSFTLDDTPKLRVYDGSTERVIIGKEGSEYGIWVRDAAGNLILSASGLGANIVGSGNIRDNSITAAKLSDDIVFGNIDAISDLDTAGDGTIHTYGASNSKAPTTSPGTLVTHGDVQYATAYETGRVYKRERTNGVWGDWVDITTGSTQLPPIASQISDADSAAVGSFHVLSVSMGPPGYDAAGNLVASLKGFQEGILTTVENETADATEVPPVLVGDRIQTFRDYFSGRVFSRRQSNRVWQVWREITILRDIISAIHLQARIITADKLDITSVHKLITDVRMEQAENPLIWKFSGFGSGEGLANLEDLSISNLPAARGVTIQGWTAANRSVIYEENKQFDVKEAETLTFELYYYQTVQFGNSYGDLRLKYTLVDATTSTTQVKTIILPTGDDTANTWHFWNQKVKIERPDSWNQRVSYVKDFTLEYTGKPAASSVSDGYLHFTALQVTRAAQGIYIGDGEIQAPHIRAGEITTDLIAAGAITAAQIESGTITAAKIASNAIRGHHIRGREITADKLAVGVIPEIEQGPQGPFEFRIYRNAVTVPDTPEGGSYNFADSSMTTIPAGWSRAPASAPSGQTTYFSVVWIDPFLQDENGVVDLEGWSSPTPAGGTGPQGPIGPSGPQGLQGLPGVNGEDGKEGPPGPDGKYREWIWTVTATADEPEAPDNSWGFDQPGTTAGGQTWTDGAEGLSAAMPYMWLSYRVLDDADIEVGDSVSGEWSEPRLMGRWGPQGLQGIQGIQGADGTDGNDGEPGADGKYREWIFTLTATADEPEDPLNSWGYDQPGTTAGGQRWYDVAPNLTADLPYLWRSWRIVDDADIADGDPVAARWISPRIVGRWGPQGPEGPQGLQGEQGIQGIAGNDGADGEPGADGIAREWVFAVTATVEEMTEAKYPNDDWTFDQTGEVGPVGDKLRWYDAAPNLSDNKPILWQSWREVRAGLQGGEAVSDNFNTPRVVGRWGPRGFQGIQGIPGQNGQDGVPGADGVESEWIFTVTATPDEPEEPDNDWGFDQPGTTTGGQVWTDEATGLTPSMPYLWSCRRRASAGTAVGAAVPDEWTEPKIVGRWGSDGPQGERGPQGLQGIAGANGVDGPQGQKGEDGKYREYVFTTTANPVIPENQWPDNGWTYDNPGTSNGLRWYDGAPNITADKPYLWQDWRVVEGSVTDGDDVTEEWLEHGPRLAGRWGERGEIGPQGERGERGIQGLQGVPGANGADGPQGPEGADGKYREYIFAVVADPDIPDNQKPDNTWGYDRPTERNGLTWYDVAPNLTAATPYLISSSRIVEGAPDPGDPIPDQWVDPPRVVGRWGADGERGPAGADGNEGAPGSKGDKGDTGVPGLGIEWIFTLTNTWPLPTEKWPLNTWGFDDFPQTRNEQVWYDGGPSTTPTERYLVRAWRRFPADTAFGAQVADNWRDPKVVSIFGVDGADGRDGAEGEPGSDGFFREWIFTKDSKGTLDNNEKPDNAWKYDQPGTTTGGNQVWTDEFPDLDATERYAFVSGRIVPALATEGDTITEEWTEPRRISRYATDGAPGEPGADGRTPTAEEIQAAISGNFASLPWDQLNELIPGAAIERTTIDGNRIKTSTITANLMAANAIVLDSAVVTGTLAAAHIDADVQNVVGLWHNEDGINLTGNGISTYSLRRSILDLLPDIAGNQAASFLQMEVGGKVVNIPLSTLPVGTNSSIPSSPVEVVILGPIPAFGSGTRALGLWRNTAGTELYGTIRSYDSSGVSWHTPPSVAERLLSLSVKNIIAIRNPAPDSAGTEPDPPDPDVELDNSSVIVTEGNVVPVLVRLATEPVGGSVTVAIEVEENESDITVSPTELTFTADNWSEWQTVNITGVADSNSNTESATITVNPRGADYASVASKTITVSIIAPNSQPHVDYDLTPGEATATVTGLYGGHPVRIYQWSVEEKGFLDDATLAQIVGGHAEVWYWTTGWVKAAQANELSVTGSIFDEDYLFWNDESPNNNVVPANTTKVDWYWGTGGTIYLFLVNNEGTTEPSAFTLDQQLRFRFYQPPVTTPPPTLNNIPNQQWTNGTAESITVTGENLAGGNWEWEESIPGVTGSGNTLSGTPNNNGRYDVRVRITTAGGTSDWKAFTITVDSPSSSLAIVTDVTASPTNPLVVQQGQSQRVRLKLATEPLDNVTVTITAGTGVRVGSSLVSGVTTTRTFTPTDWNTYKSVYVHGTDDTDTSNESTNVSLAASSNYAAPQKILSVTVTPEPVTEQPVAYTLRRSQAFYTSLISGTDRAVHWSVGPSAFLQQVTSEDSEVSLRVTGDLGFVFEDNYPQISVLAAGQLKYEDNDPEGAFGSTSVDVVYHINAQGSGVIAINYRNIENGMDFSSNYQWQFTFTP